MYGAVNSLELSLDVLDPFQIPCTPQQFPCNNRHSSELRTIHHYSLSVFESALRFYHLARILTQPRIPGSPLFAGIQYIGERNWDSLIRCQPLNSTFPGRVQFGNRILEAVRPIRLGDD